MTKTRKKRDLFFMLKIFENKYFIYYKTHFILNVCWSQINGYDLNFV